MSKHAYELYKNNNFMATSLQLQDIINVLNNEGIQLNCIDDLFNNEIMKDYKLKIKKVSLDF